MARPRTYDDGSRSHIGVRFDQDLIRLFDAVASRQGLTRNHAIEICIKQVIQNQRVPDSYFPDLESKLAQVKSRVKDRLLDRKPVNRTGDKTSKISQTL